MQKSTLAPSSRLDLGLLTFSYFLSLQRYYGFQTFLLFESRYDLVFPPLGTSKIKDWIQGWNTRQYFLSTPAPTFTRSAYKPRKIVTGMYFKHCQDYLLKQIKAKTSLSLRLVIIDVASIEYFGSFKYQYITVLIFLLSNINLFVFLTKISIISYVYWNQFYQTFFHIISKSDKKSAFTSIPPLQVLPGCVVVQVHV